MTSCYRMSLNTTYFMLCHFNNAVTLGNFILWQVQQLFLCPWARLFSHVVRELLSQCFSLLRETMARISLSTAHQSQEQHLNVRKMQSLRFYKPCGSTSGLRWSLIPSVRLHLFDNVFCALQNRKPFCFTMPSLIFNLFLVKLKFFTSEFGET